MIGGIKKWFAEWRPSAVTLGLPTFPLLVLFGLNAVDELDRTAFAVLLPDIRDHFHLTNARALGIVAITTTLALFIEIPLSFAADRGTRVRLAAIGAALWGVFSIGTGLAMSVGVLILMRVGAAGGRAVVTPTHSSLLSDYYPTEARVKTFSFHRQANSVGQIIGPALGGILGQAFGWRTPFFVFALPRFIFVLLALRLQEPERGYHERVAAGTVGTAEPEPPAGFAETFRILHKIKTIRRIWWAMPFLSIALVGTTALLSIVYRDVFHLHAAQRGLVAAVIEPLQIVGVFVAIPRVSKITMREPGFLLRFVAVVGVFNGLVTVALAYSPNVGLAIVMNALLAGTVGTLAPAFFAMISIVAPSRVRAMTFATITIFGAPGAVIFLPLIGSIADAVGVRQAMLMIVPINVITGFILASASKYVADDIAAVHGVVPDALPLDVD
jgi:branched-chain amino acid transport system ATP-binding protein